MGIDREDQSIFEGGSAPDPDQSDRALVSDAISGLQHGGRSHPAPTDKAPAAPAPPPDDGVEDRSTAGLLKALLETRDRAQTAERERDEVKRWREEQERLAKAKETPFDQMLFEKPQDAIGGFVDERLNPISSRMQTMALDFDFKLTKMAHGAEAFDEAFQAWYGLVADTSSPNPQLYFHVTRSASPGETLMQWYRRARTLNEVGDDPAAYRQKIIDETLAQYGLAGNGATASPPQGGRPTAAPAADQPRNANGQFTARHEVRLPTATSRVGRAGSGTVVDAEDGSDDAIFEAGRPDRRR
jgi:hypothetical protein